MIGCRSWCNPANASLQEAEMLDLGPLEVARLAWLKQMVSGNVWYESGAARTFVTIAEQMRDGGDPDMALRSLVPIAHRCWWTRTRTQDAPVSRGCRHKYGHSQR